MTSSQGCFGVPHFVAQAHGSSTTLMQPSARRENMSYPWTPWLSGSLCVMMQVGSKSPACASGSNRGIMARAGQRPQENRRFLSYVSDGPNGSVASVFTPMLERAPPGRRASNARRSGEPPPTNSSAASAPRPPVAARTSATTPSAPSAATSSGVAPSLAAIARRSGTASTAHKWAKPARFASSTASSPTGPHPTTTTARGAAGACSSWAAAACAFCAGSFCSAEACCFCAGSTAVLAHADWGEHACSGTRTPADSAQK
mmetsp:Transcript_21256/g.63696  ORF Transcript_21256/g.63696 Transcript_21256/m.63696 type:complete len:259 (+) Transcript_21256:149-925(+)